MANLNGLMIKATNQRKIIAKKNSEGKPEGYENDDKFSKGSLWFILEDNESNKES